MHVRLLVHVSVAGTVHVLVCDHQSESSRGQRYAYMQGWKRVASLTVIRKSCAAVPRRRRGTVCFASSRCRESTSQTYSLARRPAGSTPKFTMRSALASTRGWALYVVYLEESN